MYCHYVCSGHWHNYFMQPGKAVWARAHCILDDDDYNLSLMTMFLFWFCFGTVCGAIMFAVAADTIISFSLGRHYRPALIVSLISMIKVYLWWQCICFDLAVVQHLAPLYLQWLWYIQPGKGVWAMLSLSFFDIYGHNCVLYRKQYYSFFLELVLLANFLFTDDKYLIFQSVVFLILLI